MDKIRQRHCERRELVSEIAGLDSRGRIDRLLQETDLLNLRIEMQGKALDGFHRRNFQRNEGIDERLADLERRLPGPYYQEEGKSRTNALLGGNRGIKSAVEKISTIEMEKQGQLGRLLASVAALMTRVSDIEMGVEQMRASLGTMVETFGAQDGTADGVKEEEDVDEHIRASPTTFADWSGSTHSLETGRKYEIPLRKRKSSEKLEGESPTKWTRRPPWKKREGCARCIG